MLIEAPRWTGDEASSTIRSRIGDFTVWYRPAGVTSGSAADAFLTAFLIPAMRKESDLRCEAPVSARLLNNISAAQDLLCDWVGAGWGESNKLRLQRIDVRAEVRQSPPVKVNASAAFFTAGVDSFYTALKHLDEIDALIYVHGFDVMLEEAETLKLASAAVESAAAAIGKPLLQVITNFHDVSHRFVSWGPVHGAALGSVAPLFAGRFDRIYVPSSIPHSDVDTPWGSHASLDPLWSTEDVEIVYDGSEAGRYEKIAAIADNQFAQAYLRVCLESPSNGYNCGSCEKCLRTMVLLREAGKLERFSSFPPLDPGDLSFKHPPRMTGKLWRSIWRKHLTRLESSGTDFELQQGIRRLLGAGEAPDGGRSV